MKNKQKPLYDDEMLRRLIDCSTRTLLRTFAEEGVGKYFRSTSHIYSERIVDCVVLNLFFTRKDLKPDSAADFIKYVGKVDRAFYTNVDKMFTPIADDFYARAESVVAPDIFSKLKELRPITAVVYVVTLELTKNKLVDRNELLTETFSYAELLKINKRLL